MRALVIALLIFAAAASIAVALPAPPTSVGSTNYNATSVSIGSINATRSITTTFEGIAYEIMGEIGSANYQICLGWYCPSRPLFTPYSMRVKGVLNYSSGELVKDTKINLVIYNSTTNDEYGVESVTDGYGLFDATIPDIPATLIGSGFAIRITAYGDVEAVYDKPCVKQAMQYVCG